MTNNNALLLSICVPTYNRADTLQQTLDSILPQVAGRADVEVIVLDNASTDQTPATVAAYQQRYGAQLRYVRQPRNLGFDGNIIASVEQARGDYLAFCADDDIVCPGVYARVLEDITARHPALICLGLYPFRGANYRRAYGPRGLMQDIVFENGKEFFKRVRLGFLSVLIMPTAYARQYVPAVNQGLASAHVDITARIALQKPGPFLYLGTQAIAARAQAQPAYDSISSIHINYTACLYQLQAEGLLTPGEVREMLRYSIRGPLWRDLLRKKCLGDQEQLLAQRAILYQYYGWHPLFCLYAGLIFRLPRAWLQGPYQTAVRANQLIKRFRFRTITTEQSHA